MAPEKNREHGPSMRYFLSKLAAAAAALSCSSAALAHDFFLLPQASRDASGKMIVQATVSSNFPKADAVVTQDRIAQLYLQGAGTPKIGIDGAGTNALNLGVTSLRPGMAVAAVRTVPRDVDYEGERVGIIMEEYRVGPEAQAAVRRLPEPRILRVSSRRFAKTLICVSLCKDRARAAKALGADLEFVGKRAAGDHFQLISKGRPLGNYPVDIVMPDGKRSHITTDAAGEVHVPAGGKGPVMLFAAVMDEPSSNERFTLNLSSLTFLRE